MAVYKRTYKAYQGPLTPAWSRFTVLSRYGLSTLFNSRPFTAYTVLCFLPFLVGLVFIYFVHSSTAQMVFGVKFGPSALVNNIWFVGFLGTEAWMGFLLAAWGGQGMITKDFANLWAAWASLLSLCAFCFWLLNLKLRAREVERA
jgi:hypothetical protein